MSKYILRHLPAYTMGILLLLMVDLTNIYVPQFTAEIIDGLAENPLFSVKDLSDIVLKIFILGIIIMVGRFGWRYFILGSSRKIQYELRGAMFGHLESLSARFFNAQKQVT